MAQPWDHLSGGNLQALLANRFWKKATRWYLSCYACLSFVSGVQILWTDRCGDGSVAVIVSFKYSYLKWLQLGADAFEESSYSPAGVSSAGIDRNIRSQFQHLVLQNSLSTVPSFENRQLFAFPSPIPRLSSAVKRWFRNWLCAHPA